MWEVVCLILCFGSVFAPGSPYDPSKILVEPVQDPFHKPSISNETYALFEYDEPDVGAPAGDRRSITLLRAGITSSRLGRFNLI